MYKWSACGGVPCSYAGLLIISRLRSAVGLLHGSLCLMTYFLAIACGINHPRKFFIIFHFFVRCFDLHPRKCCIKCVYFSFV